MGQLMYDAKAADGYERAFARVSSHFIPFLLQAAGLRPGQRVLDVATGTGLAAASGLGIVGAEGHVTATDISPHMTERARERLGAAANAVVRVADGQALGFPSASFDVVVCSLGLMFFPDPAAGLKEFHRVLCKGGRAAVSVNTVPERSYNTRIHTVIGKHVPAVAADAARLFSLGDEAKLAGLFASAGFADIGVVTRARRFAVPSFAEYFDHVERGWGSAGQVFVSLPEDVKHAVREDVRQSVGDTGGPIEIEVEYRIASGRK